MSASAVKNSGRKSKLARILKSSVLRLGFYFLLSALSFIFLYPFITMIVKSLMTDDDLYNITVKWLPSSPAWSNYDIAFRRMRFRADSHCYGDACPAPRTLQIRSRHRTRHHL